jgi:hypothetical protein
LNQIIGKPTGLTLLGCGVDISRRLANLFVTQFKAPLIYDHRSSSHGGEVHGVALSPCKKFEFLTRVDGLDKTRSHAGEPRHA